MLYIRPEFFQCELLLFLVLLDTSHLVVIKRSLRGLTDWLELGLELEMEFPFLKSIDKSHGDKLEMCKTTMLHLWLESGRATKSSLVDALREMGEDGIADKLQ